MCSDTVTFAGFGCLCWQKPCKHQPVVIRSTNWLELGLPLTCRHFHSAGTMDGTEPGAAGSWGVTARADRAGHSALNRDGNVRAAVWPRGAPTTGQRHGNLSKATQGPGRGTLLLVRSGTQAPNKHQLRGYTLITSNWPQGCQPQGHRRVQRLLLAQPVCPDFG